MAFQSITESVREGLAGAFQTMASALPAVVGALVVLGVGYVVGKLLGKGVRGLLEKTDVDLRLRNTVLERVLKAANLKFDALIGGLASLFVYVAAILAAVDVLKITALSQVVTSVVLFLPNLVAGLLVLIVGLIGVDWVMRMVRGMTEEYRVPMSAPVASGLRAVLAFVVVVIALDQWGINTAIIYALVQPLAWGFAAAIAIAFGLGMKDVVAEWGREKSKEWRKGP